MRRLPLILIVLFACAHESQDPPPRAAPVEEKEPPPPAGPTRTSVKEIAKKLSGKCVGGGWIARWRSEGHMQQARPKIWLQGFEDRTGQNVDPTFMTSETEGRMRLSGVFDMVSEGGAPDFIATGKLLRLAEIGKNGARVSVYTATLDLLDAATKKPVASCSADVEGEL
ncbi:MAG: hypothetical protein IT381_06445 [Deltaproteobacteria bacterium]|nr:hypothetical protein [Deltaproteobacteria bacterium]